MSSSERTVSSITSPVKPSYAVRLLLPFARLLARDARIPREALTSLLAIDPDERISFSQVHKLLEGAQVLTGDPDLGLKAARETVRGEYGAVEYAASSAATWADSVGVVARYMRLLNDALRFQMHVEGSRVRVQFDSTVVMPRAAADFCSAAFHMSGAYLWPAHVMSSCEVSFAHARPKSIIEYDRTFGDTQVQFDNGWSGFAVPVEYMTMPLPSADPQLHGLICKHADAMLAGLPRAQTLTERVRDHLAQELSGGSPTARNVARKLSISERSLARYLQEEGTTFTELLDDLRRRMALHYVRKSELSLSEITFLLGFSHSAAFYRAFRRWTAQTPREFRFSPRGSWDRDDALIPRLGQPSSATDSSSTDTTAAAHSRLAAQGCARIPGYGRQTAQPPQNYGLFSIAPDSDTYRKQ